MIQSKALKEFFYPYKEEEEIFREVYLARKDNEGFREYLAAKTPEVSTLIKNWILAEQGILLSEMTENLENVDFSDNIIVTKHARYTPAFVHKHTFFEMIYVLEGNVINKIGDKEIYMEAGDMCLMPPGVYHCLKETTDGIIINILLKYYEAGNVLSGFMTQKNILASFFIQSLYMKKSNKYLLFHLKEDSRIHLFIENLAEEDFINVDKRKDEHSNAIKEALLNLIFNQIIRYHKDDAEYDEIVLTDSLLIIEIQSYLEKNLKTADLQSLARQFSYSPSYLSRLIQQSTGTNFSKILRRIRINKACKLLHNTSLNVNEIGEQIGYNSQRQFNRAFRDVTGITPSEYRKQHKLFPF